MDTLTDPNRRLRFFHGLSAAVIGLFLLAHLANHVALFWGQAAHVEVMALLRPAYRNAFAETLLMAALIWQVGSGLAMVWRTGRARRGLVPWVQAISGVMLAAFIANHVSAVWLGRIALNLDTDIRFAAAGIHAGLAAFFVPYYALGVFALFNHLACAISWHIGGIARRLVPAAMLVFGALLAVGIVWQMAYAVQVPAEYLETYQ